VIELEEGKKIKLNEWNVKGFTYLDDNDDRTEEAIAMLKEKGFKIIK
jgi:hypothetical protein